MRKSIGFWIPVALLAGSLSRGALAQESAPATTQAETRATEGTQERADALEKHFTQAKADLTSGKDKAAAKQLDSAAKALEKDAKSATGEVKQALDANAADLKSLATEAERGELKDPKAIDTAAGHAQLAVAKFHQSRAEEHWARKESKAAGHELRAAAHHMERGAAWLGHGTETVVRTTTRDAMVLSGKLVEGVGYVPEEVGKGIHAVGQEVDRLGWKVEPRRGRRPPAQPR